MKKTAILADKHLHLKEKISSALELGQQEEDADANWEWNESVLNDAHKAVQRLNLNKAFPLTNPKELRWVWVPAFVFLLTVFVLPQWDYIQKQKTAQADVLDRKEVKKEIQKLLQRQLVIERKAQEKETKVAAELSKQIKDLTAELSKGKIEKRDAFSKLSSLEQEWEKKKDQLEKMQSMMKEPLSMGMKPKMTNELMEAIEKNDFEKAAQALSKLQKQLKLGNIDKDGQQQLSDELKKMASLMNMDTPMAKALENAGQMLDASELSEALQPLQMAEMSMMDLNDLAEQMNMLQSALNDLKDCKLALAGEMGEKEGEKGFGEGEGNCFGKGFGEGEGWGPERVGPWKPGESRKQGNGMGGPGIGRGANAPNEKTDTQMTPDKLKGMFGDAPIQMILPVDGASIKGESTIGIDGSAMFEYSQQTEEAMAKERVPLPLRHQVRQYFETKQETAPADSQ